MVGIEDEKVFKEKITRIQAVKRKVIGNWGRLGIYHSGNIVKTNEGNTYLIHKGKFDYDAQDENPTAVIPRDEIEEQWEPVGYAFYPEDGKLAVSDMINNGEYKLIDNNCHHATICYNPNVQMSLFLFTIVSAK